MNIDQASAQVRLIIHVIGVILVLVAAVKMFGLLHIGISGSVTEMALVGIGLVHV